MSSANQPATNSSLLNQLRSTAESGSECVVNKIWSSTPDSGGCYSEQVAKIPDAAHFPMEPTPLKCARFGSFSLDLKAGELRSESTAVLLQEQPLQVLRILVENAGALVSREEIRKRLWPNEPTVEFEHSINAAINKLRKALGDPAAEPQYIQTVARRGYRFMVRVEWETPSDSDSPSGE